MACFLVPPVHQNPREPQTAERREIARAEHRVLHSGQLVLT